MGWLPGITAQTLDVVFEFELSIPSIASKKTVAGFLLTDLASLNLDGGANKKFFGLSKEVLAAV